MWQVAFANIYHDARFFSSGKLNRTQTHVVISFAYISVEGLQPYPHQEQRQIQLMTYMAESSAQCMCPYTTVMKCHIEII